MGLARGRNDLFNKDSMAIQDLIFNLEEGKGQKVLRNFGIGLLALLLILVYLLGQFRGLRDAESMDAAQLARNLAQGRGFTTDVVRPLALWQLNAADVGRVDTENPKRELLLRQVPDTLNAPLYPIVLAGIFKITGQTFDFTEANLREAAVYAPERWMAIFGILCLLGVSWLTYLLACEMFDQRVGLLALGLVLGTDLMWQFSVSGLDTTLLTLLLMTSAWAWHRALWYHDQQGNPGAAALWVGIGALAQGLLPLTRYSLWWTVFASFLLLAWVFRSRAGLLAVAGALLLVPSTLWFIRNMIVCGNPLGLAWFTPLLSCDIFPSDSLWATLMPDLDKLTPRMIGRKWLLNFRQFLENFPVFSGSLAAGALALICLLHPFRRKHAEWLKWWALVSLALAICGASFGVTFGDIRPMRADNPVIIFLPLLAIFAGAMLFIMLDRMTLPHELFRPALGGFVILLNAVPLILQILPPPEPMVRYPPYYPAMFRLTGSWLKEDEMMVCDLPAASAWYGRRTSLQLPTELPSLYRINDFVFVTRIRGLLMTPNLRDLPLQSGVLNGPYKAWADVVLQKGLPNLFPLTAGTLLPPSNGYFFLSDLPRWFTASPDGATKGE
jgi:hypothetical protein